MKSNVQFEALDFKYLLLEYYKKLRISENELAVIFMIDHLLDQKNTLITPDLLSLKMNLKMSEIDSILVKLIEKNFLQYDMGKRVKVSLKPLKEKLYDEFQVSLAKEKENTLNEEKANYLQNIYQVFEKELNRTLSPLEFSLIGEWVDHGYTDETIINALKEAMSKGKKTLKSVDKILLQWEARDDLEKNGYTSISPEWDKNLEETLKIVNTKWLDD